MSTSDAELPSWLESIFGGSLTRLSSAEALEGLSPRARQFVNRLVSESEQDAQEAQCYRSPPHGGLHGDLVVLVGDDRRLVAVQLDEDTEVVVVFGEDDAITKEIGEWTDQSDRFVDALRYVEGLLA